MPFGRRDRYGFVPGNGRGVTYRDFKTQSDSLKVLGDLAQRGSIDPYIRYTALKIVRNAQGRDDQAELEALFNAIKHGDPEVKPLRNGLKYVADPRFSDYFTAPKDLLQMAENGANGGDCDDHTALMCALGASLGFKMGLRAWGRKGDDSFSHVYAVAAYPKRPPFTSVLGLDTTVDESEVGWEPPEGEVLTAWLT